MSKNTVSQCLALAKVHQERAEGHLDAARKAGPLMVRAHIERLAIEQAAVIGQLLQAVTLLNQGKWDGQN